MDTNYASIDLDPQNGYTNTNINIGGNARVQLGDQYHSGLSSWTISSRDAQERSYRCIETAAAAIQLIELSCKIVREDGSTAENNGVPSINVAHSQAACKSLTALSSTVTHCINNLPAQVQSSGTSEALSCTNLLLEIGHACKDMAEGLGSALHEASLSAAGGDYRSLCRLLQNECSETDILEARGSLERLRTKTLSCLLLLPR